MVKNITFVLLILAAPFIIIKEASSAICSSCPLPPGSSLWVYAWSQQPILFRSSSDSIFEEAYSYDGYDMVGIFTDPCVPRGTEALYAKRDLVKFCVNSNGINCEELNYWGYWGSTNYVRAVSVGDGIEIWVKNGYQNQISTNPPIDGKWARVVLNMNNFLNTRMRYTADPYLNLWFRNQCQ